VSTTPSNIVELPGGESAVLKNDDEMTNKEVKAIRRAARVAMSVVNRLQELGFDENKPETWSAFTAMTDEEADQIDLFQRECVIVRLKSWTLDKAIPTTVDEVDNLPRSIYAALTTAAAKVNLSDDFGMENAANPSQATDGSAN
jgi:hypothetical protein